MGNRSKRIDKTKKSRVIPTSVPFAIGVKGFDARSISVTLTNQVPSETSSSVGGAGLDRAFSVIATNTWRVIQKMLDVESREPKPEMQRVFRHIEAIQDALKEIGVETIDHTGQLFDTGSAVKVVTSEKRAGLAREEIIETLKPTVRRDGRLLQQGEVVVGEPEEKNDNLVHKSEHSI